MEGERPGETLIQGVVGYGGGRCWVVKWLAGAVPRDAWGGW